MSRSAAAVFAAVLMGAGLAHAEAPVATAGATQAPPAAAPDTATQIEDFIRKAPAPSLDEAGPDGVTSSADEPRKVHGQVGVTVGSGGYRSAYVVSVMPVGKTGTLALAVSETRGGKYGGPQGYYGRGGYGGYGGYGAGTRQSIGLSLALGDAAKDGCRSRDRVIDPYGLEGRPDMDRVTCREHDADH